MSEIPQTMIWAAPDGVQVLTPPPATCPAAIARWADPRYPEALEEARWYRYLDELTGKPSLTQRDVQWLRGLQTDILYSRMVDE